MATQVEIAKHLDLSERRVRDIQDNLNLPKDCSLDEARVTYIRYLRKLASGHTSESGIDLTQERAWLARRQREEAELRIAEKRKDLLPAKIVLLAGQSMVANAKQKLLALAWKIESRIPGLPEGTIEAVDKIVREALHELGNAALPRELEAELVRSCDDMAAAREDDIE